MSAPAPPDDLQLPFFAYGLLKPTELGYHHVAALVSTAETASTTGARLCIRDGLPLLLNEPHGRVHGALLTPTSGKKDPFYQAIRGFEPARQYQGFSPVEVVTARGRRAANTLWARRPDRGTEQFEGSSWSSADDPLLTEALGVVRRDAERLLGDVAKDRGTAHSPAVRALLPTRGDLPAAVDNYGTGRRVHRRT
jgi:Gamma-glutamyl cyclotransferase, AIG2-like